MSDASGGMDPFSVAQPSGPVIPGLSPGIPGQATPPGPGLPGSPTSAGNADAQGDGQGPQQAGQPSMPAIKMPTGGGAIRGIGETFAVSPATGTASLSIPVPASPGRAGSGPDLSLSYDSGAGNGAFGYGWQLSVPMITRKTDKGIPRYDDEAESDVFILSGAEDLVPVLRNGRPDIRNRHADGATYQVKRYRPRVEGLFARIERWTRLPDGQIHWRSITRDNVTSRYGTSPQSRVSDPDPSGSAPRVFSWLLAESYDDKGNMIVYSYKAENGENVDLGSLHEANRPPWARTAARYLKSVRYGNAVSGLAGRDPAGQSWMFEVILDYGEHDAADPTPAESRPWPCRRDPFSSCRAGFEIRIYRLCRRILIFHNFPGEPGVGDRCLVRSLDCGYQEAARAGGDLSEGEPLGSYLVSVTSRGWRRLPEGGYLVKAMPPLELDYSPLLIDDHVQTVDPGDERNLPAGVDGASYQWADLDGEGIPGILTEQGTWWLYKQNLGSGRLGPTEPLITLPSLADLGGGRQQFMDLAGDGHLDLVQLSDPAPGFTDRTINREWAPFSTFSSLPVIAWDDPNLRFADLTGDGLADVLITGDDALIWHWSLSTAGFAPARRTGTPPDEAAGPRLVFADGDQTLFLADMTGDGLSDLVRIRNGQVCYWPNHGYGRFGRRVQMDHAPVFDHPELFDPGRIRLADVDGSGTTDLIYLGPRAVSVHLNQSGNAWARPRRIDTLPVADDLRSVSVTDLLGTGTACLVWSSPLPADAGRALRYMELTGGRKPHLLVGVRNNLGSETRLSYAPSTTYYLADKAAGVPWVTSLPFPVHVVARVETCDRIGRNKFVTSYTYHHGYFDGVEREFRGFGLIEQTDTEKFAALGSGDAFPGGRNLDAGTYLPPAVTKTWFHTGVPPYELRRLPPAPDRPGGGLLADAVAFERMIRDNAAIPAGLSPANQREAYRSLKGSELRKEVRALDGTALQANPYTVTEHSYAVRVYQPIGPNRHGVFMAHPAETVSHSYERHLGDPRTAHSLTIEVDQYGNVLKSAAIGYGRSGPAPGLDDHPAVQAVQRRPLITYTESAVTNAVDGDDTWRTPLPSESRTWELTGVTPVRDGQASAAQISAAWAEAPDIAIDARPGPGLARRLFAHSQSIYRRDDLSGPLPPGRLESLALPERSYRLAFPDGLIGRVFGDRVGDHLLAGDGGYTRRGGRDWWMRSGRVSYSPDDDTPEEELRYARQHFFLPHRFADPFGNVSAVRYDRYDLVAIETRDPVANTVSAGVRDQADRLVSPAVDYRVLQPAMVMDPNRNRAFAAYDTLGMVVGTAVAGKPGEHLGDSLAGFEPDLTDEEIAAYFADPVTAAAGLLGQATTRVIYDLDAYWRTCRRPAPEPAAAATLTRETHESSLRPGETARIDQLVAYSDGMGRDIQHKVLADRGPLAPHGADVFPRWIGTGWTINDNKGNPVRQYEPFFSPAHRFEFAAVTGVSAIVLYDPLSRAVATLNPDHSFEKVVFDAWRRQAWDANDTVLANPATDPDVGGFVSRLPRGDFLPTWYEQRQDGTLGAEQQRAAEAAAVHARTPSTVLFDPLGRPFCLLTHNRYAHDGVLTDQRLVTRAELDIQGNRLATTDALGRTVSRYVNDARGRRLHEANMDAGQRWELGDVNGAPILTDNSREFLVRTEYDPLRRPTTVTVRHNGQQGRIAVRTSYGESEPNPAAANLRGHIARVEDGAGIVTNDRYDFKGNLLATTRRVAAGLAEEPDWAHPVTLEPERYATGFAFDALNRPIRQTAADGSTVAITYNRAGQTDRVSAGLPGDDEPTTIVRHTGYNARGQQVEISYGNDAMTRHEYDPATFRLVGLHTTRRRERLQYLSYVYDPVGNISHIGDHAQQTLFFRNKIVEPERDFTYDALYRLIRATGREHVGQAAGAARLPSRGERRAGAKGADPPQPADCEAMARYTEDYRYDAVGNITSVVHRGADPQAPGWTRRYSYHEPSRLEPDRTSNRLSSTRAGDGPIGRYAYDEQGNVTAMPQLRAIRWDYRGLLRSSSPDPHDTGEPETTYYSYDFSGKRVSKATARARAGRPHPPAPRVRHLYVGLFELWERHRADRISMARTTLRVVDDSQLIALAETRTAGGSGPPRLLRYQRGDHLESVALELTADGTVLSYEEYFPFGGTSYQALGGVVEAPKRYRYTGKELDRETGFYYYGLRYYASWLGRWTSVDPAGAADGLTPYAYVRNNPVRMVDPMGAQGVEDEQAGVCRVEYPTCTADNPAGAMSTPDTGDAAPPPADTSQAATAAPAQPPPANPKEQQLWDAAEQTNYEGSSVDALIDYYSANDDPLVRKSALDLATVRATVAVRSWDKGDYGTSIFNYTMGIVDSFGFTILGDTHAGTAKNVAIGIATGGALKGLAPGGFISEAISSATSGGTGLATDVAAGETGNAILLSTKPKGFGNVFGHNAVGVEASGDAPTFFDQTIDTDQPLGTADVLRGGQPAEFAPRDPGFDPAAKGWSTIRIPVTPAQAQAALDAAQAQSALGPQPYSVLTNSCTTNCITVLGGAGLRVPWWARTPSLLRFWAQGQGTTVATPPGAQ